MIFRKKEKKPSKDPVEHRIRLVEYHKRWALAAACLVFGVLGVGAGTFTNRRAVRAAALFCLSVLWLCIGFSILPGTVWPEVEQCSLSFYVGRQCSLWWHSRLEYF